MYANLSVTASQRGESYHPIIHKITNGQLSLKDSGKRLTSSILSVLKDLPIFKYRSMRGYDRRAQLDFTVFQYLVCTISNFALKKIEIKWRGMATTEKETPGKRPILYLYVFADKIDGQSL
jgi:hypothetical protein